MAFWSLVACSFSLLGCVLAQYLPAIELSALGGSYPDCPCLDVELNPVTRNILEKYRQSDGTFLSGTLGIYPAGYGNAKCIAWDDPSLPGDPRCQLLPTPEYCLDSWCFVNASNCERNSLESQAFSGLSISYQTCGSVGFQVRSRQRLDNRTIRVHIPNGEYVLDDQSEVESPYLNAMIRFAVPVLQTAGVETENIVYKRLSAAARQQFPNSNYSACVWDTVIGNIDLCVGDFWDTQPRRSYGGIFTSAVSEESMYFFGTSPGSAPLSFGEIVVAPLKPFTGTTWAMLLASTLLAGCAFCCFETFEFADEEQEEGSESWYSRFSRFSQFAVDGAYFGFASFTSAAAIDFEALTLSGKSLIVGFSIFITIVLASFTANTASLLVAKAIPKQDVTDFGSAITKGVPVCVPASFSTFFNTFVELYGSGWQNNVQSGASSSFCLTAIDSGDFRFAVASELTYGVRRSAGESCSTKMLGTYIVSAPTGWFASSSVYQAIGEAITIEKQKGTWEAIKKAIFLGDACPPADSSVVNEQAQLTPENMAGTCLLLLFFCGFGLVIRLAQLGSRFFRCRPPKSESDETPKESTFDAASV